LTAEAAAYRADQRVLRVNRQAKIKRLTRLGGVGAAASVWILWGTSTCTYVDYLGWRTFISLRAGVLRYGQTQRFPDPMKGRMLYGPGQQPMFGWRVAKTTADTWRYVLSSRDWNMIAHWIGLVLPMRNAPPTLPSPSRYQELRLPLWIPAFLLTTLAALLFWRDRRRKPPGHCRFCGYNLTANVSGICPECGVPTGGKIVTASTTRSAEQQMPGASADDRSLPA
jgi:hypothetical protein